MASDTSPTGIHELEHSHQLVATGESLKSSNVQSVTKTQDEDAIMMDQAGTQKFICLTQIAIL